MKQYVVVHHAPDGLPRLFYAPLDADIQKGDKVYCDTDRGVQRASVISKFKTDEHSFLLDKVKEICGVKPGHEIRQIESVVKRIKMDYAEKTGEEIREDKTVVWDSTGENIEEWEE